MLGAGAAALLRLACAPRAHRFAAALDDVGMAQRATLARIVKAAATTGYGRSFGLLRSDGLDAFRARLPIVDYADIEPWIAAQRRGSAAALAPGLTRSYEPTSGSSGATKRIPYNDALLGAFRGIFAIWACDLLTHALQPRSGRIFMSLSPPIADGDGFSDDREYLGGPLRALLGRFIVSPPTLRDPAAFRDALAAALLATEDLEVISIWHPGYLLILLDHVETHRDRLAPALPVGRRQLLRRDPLPWTELWPALQLVSCWTAAAAAGPARQLAQRLPHARFQGKGLLATEGPVSVPLSAAGGCVPCVDSVFLEFEDAGGRLHLLDELECSADYAVILTQPGGLLRYRLGDLVRVGGRFRDAPLLEFNGRADAVSDLVGEKLGEVFVAEALDAILPPEAFRCLLPVLPNSGRPGYCLLTDAPDLQLSARLEAALLAAFRYREARLLEQLAAVELRSAPDMRRRVHDALVVAGMKPGDIKEAVLWRSVDRARRILDGLAQRNST